jgi:hypothetical protein
MCDLDSLALLGHAFVAREEKYKLACFAGEDFVFDSIACERAHVVITPSLLTEPSEKRYCHRIPRLRRRDARLRSQPAVRRGGADLGPHDFHLLKEEPDAEPGNRETLAQAGAEGKPEKALSTTRG